MDYTQEFEAWRGYPSTPEELYIISNLEAKRFTLGNVRVFVCCPRGKSVWMKHVIHLYAMFIHETTTMRSTRVIVGGEHQGYDLNDSYIMTGRTINGVRQAHWQPHDGKPFTCFAEDAEKLLARYPELPDANVIYIGLPPQPHKAPQGCPLQGGASVPRAHTPEDKKETLHGGPTHGGASVPRARTPKDMKETLHGGPTQGGASVPRAHIPKAKKETMHGSAPQGGASVPRAHSPEANKETLHGGAPQGGASVPRARTPEAKKETLHGDAPQGGASVPRAHNPKKNYQGLPTPSYPSNNETPYLALPMIRGAPAAA